MRKHYCGCVSCDWLISPDFQRAMLCKCNLGGQNSSIFCQKCMVAKNEPFSNILVLCKAFCHAVVLSDEQYWRGVATIISTLFICLLCHWTVNFYVCLSVCLSVCLFLVSIKKTRVKNMNFII